MIYLVEDDNAIRELVTYTLNSSGLEDQSFGHPLQFRDAMELRLPDLIMLDIMLPEEDGLHILKTLRADPKTADIPVMMLSAKSTEYDKVLGLDAGADDYVPKPFGMMELLARVRALLRRTTPRQSGDEYQVGPLCLSVSRHQVLVDGQSISLTLKEYELLRTLMEHQGIVMTRDQLLTQIWGYAFDGESRTVDVHIRTLRQKLGSAADLIGTIRGVGYRFG